MSYIDVYRKRLNRYGLNYQSRIQGQRERNFDDYLLKSIYRVDFWYDDTFTPATLERYKQDYTETQCYLLTRREVKIPNGTILMIEGADSGVKPWMVWWLEEREASGYNTYVVLKMTHLLTWRGVDGQEHEQWAYFSGPGTSAISDSVKSAVNEAIYKQNDNLHTFITSYNKDISRETYFEVGYKETTSGYVVTELDVNSTPGVVYVSVDPSYTRDKTEITIPKSEKNSADYFWLQGGKR